MNRKQGFTLIELLVVLSIIMMLMLLVIPNVTKKIEGIRNKGSEALIRVINTQIQLYEINKGHLPNSVNDLINDGYIEKNQSMCPNGKSIHILAGEAYCE